LNVLDDNNFLKKDVVLKTVSPLKINSNSAELKDSISDDIERSIINSDKTLEQKKINNSYLNTKKILEKYKFKLGNDNKFDSQFNKLITLKKGAFLENKTINNTINNNILNSIEIPKIDGANETKLDNYKKCSRALNCLFLVAYILGFIILVFYLVTIYILKKNNKKSKQNNKSEKNSKKIMSN